MTERMGVSTVQCYVFKKYSLEEKIIDLKMTLFFSLIFIYLAVPGHSCSMQDLYLRHANSLLWHVGSSSLTRDQTQAPSIGSSES